MTRPIRWALLPALLLAIWLAAMATGTGAVDRSVLLFLYSGERPGIRSVAAFVTLFGEWEFLLPLAVIVGGALLVDVTTRRDAFLFLAICLIGRALVQLQKIGIARLRPEEREQLVPVNTYSFPSGHSSNSMIVFLAIALVLVPVRLRPQAVILALAAAMAIGISRPMLGVHWPSDVVGGWAFGAAWVLILAEMSQRWPFDRPDEKWIKR